MPDARDDKARRALVDAARRGDRGAMCTLWETHRRWVAAILLAYKPAHADLDDLLQDVAMTVVRRLSDLRERDNFRAWLRTVAINAARVTARPGRHQPHLRLVGDFDDPGADPAGQRGRDDEASRVLALARQLPEAYREPLMLRAVQGMRPREIAEMLDLTETAVQNRVARGRRLLRELAARPEAAPVSPSVRSRSGDSA